VPVDLRRGQIAVHVEPYERRGSLRRRCLARFADLAQRRVEVAMRTWIRMLVGRRATNILVLHLAAILGAFQGESNRSNAQDFL
jgi:hypothetical protein